MRRHVVEMNIVAKEVTYIILHAEVTTFYNQIKFLHPPTQLKYLQIQILLLNVYKMSALKTDCLLANSSLWLMHVYKYFNKLVSTLCDRKL